MICVMSCGQLGPFFSSVIAPLFGISMDTSLDIKRLTKYLRLQLVHNFPDEGDLEDLSQVVSDALKKLEYCFRHSVYSPNWKNEKCYFNHLNADQYVVFIYFCSVTAFLQCKNIELANKLFYLNKILHSFHCMYDTILPDIFLVIHGSGIVLGKASYADYFVVTQGCTVGSNPQFQQPKLGKYLFMYPYSSITGCTTIGNNACIANGAFVNDELIDGDSLVIGKSPCLSIKENKRTRLSYFYPH